jgi:ribose transport system ATP-binding protein
MVGREVGLFPKADARIGDVALEARGLSGHSGVQDVSLSVRSGEIVGLAGLIGAGRTETVRLICGADRKTSGAVLIDGQEVRINTPADAVRQGIGWVPEDRKLQGLILGMDVKQNTTLSILERISAALGAIDARQERAIADHYVKLLSIATPSIAKVVS